MSTDDHESGNADWYSIRLTRKIANGSFVHLTAASGTGGNPNVFMTDHLGFNNSYARYSIINSKGVFLDSPNTTDAVTYKLEWQANTNDGVYGTFTGKRILNTPGETSGSCLHSVLGRAYSRNAAAIEYHTPKQNSINNRTKNSSTYIKHDSYRNIQ